MIWFIYCLIDPRDGGDIRYVGATRDLTVRYLDHISDSRCTRKGYWIRKINKLGLHIPLVIIDICDDCSWKKKEKFWIKKFKQLVFDLVNSTDGGDGVTGLKHSKKTKAKIAKSLTGGKRTATTKEKMRQNALAWWKDPEFRAKMVNKLIGNKRGAGRKGIKHTEESKQKMRESITRRKRC